jgi:glutamate-5-semialdehyde dehydrogenase
VLKISKVRTSIGVIGIVYESRPNVTSDAAVLCFKAGNAVILRGGSESIWSNLAIAKALQTAAVRAGVPEEALSILPFTDRAGVEILAQLDTFVDLIIPRGGAGLIETVARHARMPVIKHYHGVCQAYVDKEADLEMAEAIVLNAKCQRPGVCNALETLLVHQEIAPEFLRRVGKSLEEKKVEIRGDEMTQQILGSHHIRSNPATEEDWSTEYLDLVLSVRVVENLQTALDHIDRYGSHHSDTIITSNPQTAEHFLQEVDSATVYWNASTRFTDGGEFGFGAEIGISTDKLHARGPMGLEELTSYKYMIRGSGQIRK